MTQTQCIEAPALTRLRDGRTVTIRPLTEGDRTALYEFGLTLPKHDLLYLEDDFQAPEIILRLINASYAENWRQIVAVTDDGVVVGYSAVRRLPGWANHVGDIRLIIGEQWRRNGLGMVLAEAVFEAARELGVAKVSVEMLQEQDAGRAIFEQIGFQVEGVLDRHVCDRYGQVHNLLIMSYHVPS